MISILGNRNDVDDALSRTIFPDTDHNVPPLNGFGELIQEEEKDPVWVWKDGKEGFEELLRRVVEILNEFESRKSFVE